LENSFITGLKNMTALALRRIGRPTPAPEVGKITLPEKLTKGKTPTPEKRRERKCPQP